ncbi:MAG: acyl-CoA synthetase [Pseudomonadota bacterium]
MVEAIATVTDKHAFEAQQPIDDRWSARTLYDLMTQTVERSGDRPAVSFQIKSGPKDKVQTMTWRAFKDRVTQAANLFRKLGVGPGDVVAYILPNCNETAVTLLAGATAGIVSPINPLLDAEQIADILRETGAKVVVTLAPFPKSDLNAKVAEATANAPEVKTILQVDLTHYLSPPVSWLVPLLRPKAAHGVRAEVMDFNTAVSAEAADALSFEQDFSDPICAYFHTGGTTGMPKVARHRHSGIIYNGWCGDTYIFTDRDVLLCPLPLFHCLAAYPVLMSCLFSGAQMVMVTPAGYRGDGVYENFWKLIERHRVSFLITVPTAAAALMQRPVDADVSSLRYALSGSAPLPSELYRRFEEATGLTILEGYGMTEATCLVSINPPAGERKIGSVGFPFPYTEVKILDCAVDGTVKAVRDVDEIGEICVKNPGVVTGETYTEAQKNRGLYTEDGFLRTGDLGRLDADGYIWITGRAKDLIIRGGHNIDPAVIEDALMSHDDVAFAGAIGQPDPHSGEVPAVYVELRDGAEVEISALQAHADAHIGERAAHPKHIEIVPEMPKTAVGKVFKPDLRRMAVKRVYDDVLSRHDIHATVSEVVEDKTRGLVARLSRSGQDINDEAVNNALGTMARPWEWAD